MVQKNFYESDIPSQSEYKGSSKAGESLNYAPIQDRFLAGILDILFIFSLSYLSISPLLKRLSSEIMISAGSNSSDPILNYLWYILFNLYLVHMLYQSLFIYWKHATPGMMLRGIKVQSVVGKYPHRISFTQSLLRASLMALESFFGFFPLLEVVTHPYGRSIHDRGADTVVVSISNGKSRDLPNETEVYFFKQVLYIFFFGISFYVLSSVFQSQLYVLTQATQIPASKVIMCSDVDPTVELGEGRLDLVLAQYLSKNIDKECFNQELDSFFWSQNLKSSALAYVAKGLQLDSEDGDSSEYFDYVCKNFPQENDYCIWSQHAMGMPISKNDLLKQVEISESKSFKVFALNWSLKSKEIGLSHELLNGLQNFNWAQKLTAEAKVKLYWFDNKTQEALGGMHILLDVLGEESGASLLSWFCMQQLEQVTSPEKSTCVELETIASQNRELRSQLDVSLALLKTRSFTNKNQIRSEDMNAWFVEKGWPELVEYYSKGNEKNNKDFLKKLESLLLKNPENSRISLFIKEELNNIYASLSSSNRGDEGPTIRLPASENRGTQ